MNSMLVYKITLEDLGNSILIDPRVPLNTAKNEDKTIDRIPVATTIPNCINALELTSMITKENPILKVYVYASVVPVEYLEEPNINVVKVPDQWKTGELWVMYPWTFTKLGSATLRKHMEIPYSAYSRYSFTMNNFDEVVDRVCAANIYGEITNFSFIDLDNDRIESAYFYQDNKPTIDWINDVHMSYMSRLKDGESDIFSNIIEYIKQNISN